jgi:hypothetical protein
MSVEALKDIVSSINDYKLPSFLEHDSTRPPIGRVGKAWLEQLDDGEWGCFVECEVFGSIPVLGVPQQLAVDAVLSGAAAQPDGLEITTSRLNYPSLSGLEHAASAARSVGEVSVDDRLLRKSLEPDPYLLIGLGLLAGGTWWILRGFFVNRETAETNDLPAHAEYEEFRRRTADAVAKSEPLSGTPTTDLEVHVPVGRREVLIRGSVRSRDPAEIGRALDGGARLLMLAIAFVEAMPNANRLRTLHFNWRDGERDWAIAYGLDEDAVPFLIAPVRAAANGGTRRAGRPGGP